MIEYEFGRYGLTFFFQLRGSIFPKAFVWSLPSGIASFAAVWFFQRFPDRLPEQAQAGPMMALWGSFTGMLGFLLVFRTQIAFSRFWEGGTLLQKIRGVWFNATSNLIAFSNSSSAPQDELKKFQQLLIKLMSLLYCTSLQQITSVDDNHFEVLDIAGIAETSLLFLSSASNRPEVVMQWVQRLIVENTSKGVIPIAPPLTSRIFQELSNGIVDVQNAMKIKEFPFPFPYAQMITAFLLFITIINPMIAAMFVQSGYVACTISLVIPFALWSLNFVAAELESPFGEDPNDLPVANLQERFNESLRLLLHPMVATLPHYEPTAHLMTTRSCRLTMMSDVSVRISHGNNIDQRALSGITESPSISSCEADVNSEADIHGNCASNLVLPINILHLDFPPRPIPQARSAPMPVSVVSSPNAQSRVQSRHSEELPSSSPSVMPEPASIHQHGQEEAYLQQASSTSCNHKVSQFSESGDVSRIVAGTDARETLVTPSVDADPPRLEDDAEMTLFESESGRWVSNMAASVRDAVEEQQSRLPITL